MNTRNQSFLTTNNEALISADSSRRAFWIPWLAIILGLFCLPWVGVCQTPISCGQTVEATTKSDSEIDQYSFAGTAGQMLSVALSWGGSAGYGEADIYSPGGQLVTNVVTGGGGAAINLDTVQHWCLHDFSA